MTATQRMDAAIRALLRAARDLHTDCGHLNCDGGAHALLTAAIEYADARREWAKIAWTPEAYAATFG